MRFPREAQEGGADARRRLDEARDHERQAHEALEASRDTAQELGLATELGAAAEKTAAREAWLAWAERDA